MQGSSLLSFAIWVPIVTGFAGKYVPIADTVRSFREIVDGKYDHLPEQAFYMVGTIEEAVEKAKTL